MITNRDAEKGEIVEIAKVTMTLPIEERNFDLGAMYITPGAWATLDREDLIIGLGKHLRGDWGDVCREDWLSNEVALTQSFRLLSSYKDRNGAKFWIITEADRSMTTVLLPEEY